MATMQIPQRITPFLSFPSQAGEAANYYVSVFPEAAIIHSQSGPDGSVMLVEFTLMGMKFVSLNTGQDWRFTEATSFAVACDTQAEIDHLWSHLVGDGGRELACSWLQDKFGVFWQIVPSKLSEWFASGEPEKIGRMTNALFQMTKLDIATLQSAFDGAVEPDGDTE
jgi:predicted 3-demethylubiquinone-9 3-methyltransferase (glyoxalase superfamily)